MYLLPVVRIEWDDVTVGSRAGAVRAAAARVGISEAEYLARIASGAKWCTLCKAWRLIAEFSADASRTDGRAARCKRHGRRTADGPTKPERQSAALLGLRWCRRCAAWLPADEVRAGLCRDHANEYAREHYATTGGRVRRGYAAARRRRVAPVPADAYDLLMESTEGLCAYGCGRPATTMDHVAPVASGGQTEPGYIVPACVSCNSSKKDSDPAPWLLKMTDGALSLVLPTLTRDGPTLD